MNIHPPQSWMVEASNSPYDLDNICLKELDADGAYGEYELEHLIIEGHAYDVLSGQSPRGLQFNLGTLANPVMYDTIVMANLVCSNLQILFTILNFENYLKIFQGLFST